jgi:hypothetical protein
VRLANIRIRTLFELDAAFGVNKDRSVSSKIVNNYILVKVHELLSSILGKQKYRFRGDSEA